MTVEELLQECETLTHHGRIRRMIELGQRATSEPVLRMLLDRLAQGDVYQRVLATQACSGSRDTAQITRALADPSRSVRSVALRLAAHIYSDDELQAVLPRAPLDLQITLIRVLARLKRQEAIDLYLETLAQHDPSILREVLAYGSPAFVDRHFEKISAELDLLSLSRVARHHPELVVAHLRSLVSTRETPDPQFVFQVNTLLSILTKSSPGSALALVQLLAQRIPLKRLQLQPLVEKRPRAMVDLVLASREGVSLDLGKVARRLDEGHLLALFTRYPSTITTSPFAKLAPAQRLELYRVCGRGWRNSDGILAYYIIAALPTEERTNEGRRHLALPALATRPLERLPYAAFLPWEEARALLDIPLRSPDAELRGAALKGLIGAVLYQRAHLAEVLQLVRNRRNEQDPVRREMLQVLAALPHAIWQAEHLDELAQIAQDTLNATDLSFYTAQALERLVVHTFPFHPAWCAQQLAAIYRARGRVSVYHLDAYLSEEHVREIAPALTPMLQAWQNRESETLLLTIAYVLGKRLPAFPELADLLEKTVEQTLESNIANSILHLFLEHLRARAYLLIPRLLRQDKSAILLSSVYTYLHRQRQDLLTPFLGQFAYTGRFSTGHTRFVPPFEDGFYRWTARQQRIYASTLLEVVHARDHRAVHEWLRMIQRLAVMPALDVAPLVELASDTRPPVREAALRALGHLDAGQGIPTLLEALNDERARIAIYALRNALLAMPPEEALKLLRATPLKQVTVAKEVIRLIGELASETAYQELLSWEKRELHRDVRVALLRALWDYQDRAETWELFTRAAQSSDTALARGVVHIPANSLSPFIQQHLTDLTATLLAHPEIEVRMATLTWRGEHPVADPEHTLFARLLTLLHSPFPEEGRLASQMAFQTYTGDHAPLIGQAIQSLLHNRRALDITCSVYRDSLGVQKHRLLQTTRAILAALAEDRLTNTIRAELIIEGLPWEEVTPALTSLDAGLHADALERAQSALRRLAAHPENHLFELEAALAASPDERLRRLALAALSTQSRQASGWSDEAIARLEKYRRDPSPLIAEAAQFTFVP